MLISVKHSLRRVILKEITLTVYLNCWVYLTINKTNNRRCASERYARKSIKIIMFQVGAHIYASNQREGPKLLEATVSKKIEFKMYQVPVSNLDVFLDNTC